MARNGTLGYSWIMFAINVNGTSDNTCRCESWLKHWQRFSGQLAGSCCVSDCTEQATVGAHIQKRPGSQWYIVPLCDAHNRQAARLEISDYVTLVQANVADTCGQDRPQRQKR